MQCPKCGYERQAGETTPDYECPKCGVIYAKYAEAERQRAVQAEQAKAKAVQDEKNATIAQAKKAAAAQRAAEIPAKTLICTSCGAVGNVKNHTPGSIWIEILLWCFFLVPGLIYTIWRYTQRGRVCAACGDKRLIPVGTPKGRALLAEVAPELQVRAR